MSNLFQQEQRTKNKCVDLIKKTELKKVELDSRICLLTIGFSKLKKKKVDMSLAILAENNQNYTDYVNRRQEVYDRIKNPNAGMDSEIRSNFARFSKDGSFKDLYRLSRSHKESKQVEERLRDVEFTIERFRVSSMGKLQPSTLPRQSTVSFHEPKPDGRLLNLDK